MTAMPPKETLKEISPATAPAKKKGRIKKSHRLGAVLAGAAILAAIAGYIIYGTYHQTTDDAYTTGNIHDISSRVAGTVVEVAVEDNQFVHKGQVMVRLDPRDFQVQVAKAQADYNRARANFDRVTALRGSLHGDLAISKQEYDEMEASLGMTQATLDDARNQLGYCTITAPADGFVGNKTVQTGNRLAVGTVLMSVVQDLWVVANYKETQVGKMVPGQLVEVMVDAIPGHTFTGRIDSFSPGSGSVFALLPPQNATGNFTKIVQRVPVKIIFDHESIRGFEERLVPGLSVETDVHLKSRPEEIRTARNE